MNSPVEWGYNEVARTNELVRLGYLAHVRRYFIDADQVLPKELCADHRAIVTSVSKPPYP